MIAVTSYSGQKVGVFGLGKAGRAAAAALQAGGAEVFVWDDSEKSVTSYGLRVTGVTGNSQLVTRNYVSWPWSELKALVLSPGIPLTHPKPHPVVELAHRHHCPVIGEMELLYQACPQARYVGITGTNGKSTTTTLIGHILSQAGLKIEMGGNLGTPALALSPLGKGGAYVLELSSYQLDLVKITRFDVAVLLNLTPDHLDRHGDMAGYAAAKRHIFDRQQAGNVAVIAVDDEYTREIVEQGAWNVEHAAKLVEVSSQRELKNGIYVKDGYLYDTTSHVLGTTFYDLTSIATLTGRHNWQNAAAAWATARACGVPLEVIYKAMQTFPGLRHRLQLVTRIKGVRFINDSKATNADATANALAPYRSIYWIAGGKPKAGGIATLSPYFSHIMHAFLIGEAEEEFAETLKGRVAFTRCGTLDVAVKKAAAMAFAEGRDAAVVLLSPACASFDQFANFEERGDAFCRLAEEISHAA